MLYVDQILKLEKENRIVAFDGRPKDMLGMPYAVHMLRTEEVAEAILRISYVDGMLAAERLRDEDKPPAEEWRLAIMELVALERGENVPRPSGCTRCCASSTRSPRSAPSGGRDAPHDDSEARTRDILNFTTCW